jgi:hypothetical protein
LSEAVGEAEILNVFQIRGGKVIRLLMYSNQAHGFADLGLEG